MGKVFCGECRYWDEAPRDEHGNVKGGWDTCRRNPPTVHHTKGLTLTLFPATRRMEWCGKGEPRDG